MSRSLRVRHDCINEVKLAVIRNGYNSQRVFADDIGFSISTVSNFLTGKPVSYAHFEELCHRLSLDWREISTPTEEVTSTPPTIRTNTQKKTAIPRLGNSS